MQSTGSLTVIDHESFPHLMDAIIEHAPLKALLNLRGTASTYRDRVDRQMWYHSVVSDEQTAGVPAQRQPGPVMVSYPSPSAYFLPILEDPSTNLRHLMKPNPAWTRAIRHVHVLDLVAPMSTNQRDPALHVEIKVDTVRFRLSDTNQQSAFMNSQYDSDHPLARKYVFFGTSGNMVAHQPHAYLGGETLRKVVINVDWWWSESYGCTLKVLPSVLEASTQKGPGPRTVVFIVHDLPDTSMFDQSVDRPATVTSLLDILARILNYKTSDHYAIVNLEELLRYHSLDPSEPSWTVEELKNQCRRAFKGRWGASTDGDLEVLMPNMTFMSRQAYQATLEPGEWELETVV